MKKALMTLLAAFIALCGAQAQLDLRILNHLAVGAEVSSLGVGVDASMPITPFIDVQAGYTIFPGFKFNTALGLTHPAGELEKVPVKAKPMMKGGKVLVNVMPLPMLTSFHVTAGVYFGSDNMTSIYSTELIPHSTAVLGDYLLEPDSEGNIDAMLKVKPVKTYLGIGIGRGVPKGRVGFKMDIGCLLWGKPSVYCNNAKVEDTDASGSDAKLLEVMTKLKVYPVLSFRVCGKIF